MNINNPRYSRQQLFITLYKEVFPKVAVFISQRGGSFQQVKDIFQDALIIFYERSSGGHVKKEQAYLLGISRYLWFNNYPEGSHVSINTTDWNLPSDEESHPSRKRLLLLLEQAGKKCMDMLKVVYYDKLPMDKLSERFGFTSKRSATVQKYKCMEKIRNKIKEKQLQYEDFFE